MSGLNSDWACASLRARGQNHHLLQRLMAQPLVCNASSQGAIYIKKDGLNALGHFSFPYPWTYLTRSKMKSEPLSSLEQRKRVMACSLESLYPLGEACSHVLNPVGIRTQSDDRLNAARTSFG